MIENLMIENQMNGIGCALSHADYQTLKNQLNGGFSKFVFHCAAALKNKMKPYDKRDMHSYHVDDDTHQLVGELINHCPFNDLIYAVSTSCAYIYVTHNRFQPTPKNLDNILRWGGNWITDEDKQKKFYRGLVINCSDFYNNRKDRNKANPNLNGILTVITGEQCLVDMDLFEKQLRLMADLFPAETHDFIKSKTGQRNFHNLKLLIKAGFLAPKYDFLIDNISAQLQNKIAWQSSNSI